MSFYKIMSIFSVYILIFVILSGYTYGKLRHRPKRGHSGDVEDLMQHLRKQPKESEKSSQESIDEGKVSAEGSENSSEDKSTGESSENSGSSSSDEESLVDSKELSKGSKIPRPLWKKGKVPFHIDRNSYDNIIIRRIKEAMKGIEAASCVIFKNVSEPAAHGVDIWLHITNPDNERECVHETRTGEHGEKVLVLGFECMRKQDITHALLHALGFKDEVTHPQRDSYVRVLWENIQPKYKPLFAIQNEPSPYPLVEYDTMSVMHFHDRAFSSNGGATVTPLISGLLITPSETLSPLDIMKLRLAFGHECNKRKVDDLLETCKNSLLGTSSHSRDSDSEASESSYSKSEEHNKKPDNKESGEDNQISGHRSEEDGADSGSEELAIIEITTGGTTTKSKSTTIDEAKTKLSGSKFGQLGLKKRRGRRNMKKAKSMSKEKKQTKTKKHTKTRQSKKETKAKKQAKSKHSTSKNRTKRHSRKGNKN